MKSLIVLVVAVLLMAWSCKKSETKSLVSVAKNDTLSVLKDTSSVPTQDTLKFPIDTSKVVKDTTSVPDVPCSSIDTLNAVYLEDFGYCFPVAASNRRYVINDNVNYKKFRDSIQSHYFSACDTACLPLIDFTKYTLIGISTQVLLRNDKQVLADVCNKKYIYTIIQKNYDVSSGGLISLMLVTSMNWALVPKLPKGYRVVFNVIKEYNNKCNK